MSLLELVVGSLVAALSVSLALALGRRRPDGDRAGGRVAYALRLSAVAVTTLVAAVVAQLALQQGAGPFTLALVGVPLVPALVVLRRSLAGRPSGVATWIAAVVMLGWGLLTGLGAGLFFLLPAAMMLVAAVASTGGRTRSASATSR